MSKASKIISLQADPGELKAFNCRTRRLLNRRVTVGFSDDLEDVFIGFRRLSKCGHRIVETKFCLTHGAAAALAVDLVDCMTVVMRQREARQAAGEVLHVAG